MGVKKFRQKILATQGIDSTGNSTFGGSMTFGADRIDAVQALDGATTGTTIVNHGLTYIINDSATESATAARLVWTLGAPVAGVRKIIAVQADTTRTIQVRTPTSVATFFGTTFNALEWSTNGASTAQPPVANLVGLSATQWLVDISSGSGITAQGATA